MTRVIALLLVPGFLILAIACGDEDGGDAPAPTPTAEAPAETPAQTPASEAPGEEGFRRFIPTFQAALDQGDVAFLRTRALTTPVDCTAEDLGGLGGPRCEFEGQAFDGFSVGYWRSEGGIVPVDGAFSPFDTMISTSLPGESDGFGEGSVRVYALNPGAEESDAIVTAIIERPADFAEGGPLRVAVDTTWVFEDGSWMVSGMLVAFVLGEELLMPAEEVAPRYPNWELYEGP